jgi:hypothetical protein
MADKGRIAREWLILLVTIPLGFLWPWMFMATQYGYRYRDFFNTRRPVTSFMGGAWEWEFSLAEAAFTVLLPYLVIQVTRSALWAVQTIQVEKE